MSAKFVTLALALLLLSACAPAPTAKPTAANQPQGTPELAQAAATREPEQTATATIGYEATAQAAQQTADAAQRLLAEYTAEHERNLEAMALRTQEAFTFQQTALPLRATQDAESRAIDTAMQIMHATGTADGQAFAARVPTIQAAMTQVQFVQVREITGISLTWVTIVASLVLTAVALWWLYSRIMAQPEGDPETPNELAPVVQVNTTHGPYLAADQYDFSLPADRMEHFWQGVALGKSISYGNWTPLVKGFSQDEFNYLSAELIEFGLAEWVNINDPRRGLHLSPAGKQYAKKYAQDSPSAQGFIPVRVK